MKRMLINATQPEELRVAIVEGQNLYDLDIEIPSREQKKSNVYKGIITRIEPSLEAAFINYGADRHGFLPLKEISKEYFSEDSRKQHGRARISDALKEKQELIVQVTKEERGNKGAALTTFISLAGRYMVLMPNNPRAGGVSRQISGEDRRLIREAMDQLDVPKNMGLIVRTAGVDREAEELQWDLNYLKQLWMAIETASKKKGPFLIYQEGNLVIRALRDYLRSDISEIHIDEQSVMDDAKEFMQQVMPHNLRKLKFYDDTIPLFTRYQIESQIETAFSREVTLASGGSIVIDLTEALISIDINSARATKGSDIEETAYKINLEASDEIARQLRLRDLGGLIVIDFIDMTSQKHQREVESRLRRALDGDRARVQTGRISRFGLMEMSRQRLRPSLGESSQIVCPQCNGHGTIRTVESLSLSILRLLQEESMKDQTGKVIVRVPTKVANFLANEKRSAVAEIESQHGVSTIIVADETLTLPQYEVRRLRISEANSDTSASHELADSVESQPMPGGPDDVSNVPEAAAVAAIAPASPAPDRREKREPGVLVKLWSKVFGDQDESEKEEKKPAARKPEQRGRGGDNRHRGGRSKGRNQGQDSRRRSGQGHRNQDARTQTKKPQDENNQKPVTDRKPGKQPESDEKSEGRRRGGRSRGGRRRTSADKQNARVQPEQDNLKTHTTPAPVKDSESQESRSDAAKNKAPEVRPAATREPSAAQVEEQAKRAQSAAKTTQTAATSSATNQQVLATESRTADQNKPAERSEPQVKPKPTAKDESKTGAPTKAVDQNNSPAPIKADSPEKRSISTAEKATAQKPTPAKDKEKIAQPKPEKKEKAPADDKASVAKDKKERTKKPASAPKKPVKGVKAASDIIDRKPVENAKPVPNAPSGLYTMSAPKKKAPARKPAAATATKVKSEPKP